MHGSTNDFDEGKRTFLDLRNLIGGNSSDVERFNESVVLNYSCKELYTIVSDVNSYSKFVPFCVESRILGKTSKPSPATKQEQATSVVDAELAIGFAALRETYVSEVSMRPDDFVKARAKPSALFNELSTTWQFTALPPKQQKPRTRVDFSLQYSFANQLHATLARQTFRSLSTKMIDAFALRAQTLYSKRNSP
ncbi:putative secondary metabolism biosynthetic enzyme [Malassezia yamatoensis]|uniref:Secondary metabolism biosynthetic enzyme n=1 Tax=Malassezia yamatoensis TaxID=253288 RepID=A0AAJ5YQ50_9BASI|nr:putative secondary metabolism biosynthetic enzyme [Malassezia yamatoensis]